MGRKMGEYGDGSEGLGISIIKLDSVRMRSRRIRVRSFRMCMRRVWRDLKDLEAAKDQDQETKERFGAGEF